MIGPQAFINDLRESYLRYLFSSNPLGVHNEELRAQIERVLRGPGKLTRGPILELDPASLQAESVEELIAEGTLSSAFGSLPHGGADILHRRLYSHQVAALRSSAGGKSVVVASGTGSGKTECWFYPVISELAAQPSTGIRAIVLYPMNALADDQRRVRFRSVLRDSSITYGEFTGNTDETGNADANAPRNELQSREALRRQPPNILITNPSMLEYLLLRPQDDSLFAGADLRYLVIDEAHTYRGAYAIELAHLIRRLKARLRLSKGQIRAFVLSATLARDDKAQIASFGSSLTGEQISPDSVFFGLPEPSHAAGSNYLSPESYRCFTPQALEATFLNPTNLLEVEGIEVFGEERVQRAADSATGQRALWELLKDDGHVTALREALRVGPRDISELSAAVFGPTAAVDDTLGRLVDAAAGAREAPSTSALLPARYHSFFRGLDRLTLCFSSEHEQIGSGPYAIGAWHMDERSQCTCGAPLWELLTCQDCAAWYLRRLTDQAYFSDDERGPEGSYLLVRDSVDADEDAADTINPRCLACDKAPSACNCLHKAIREVTQVLRRTCVVCNGQRVAPVMTGTMAPTQILAEEITRRQQPPRGQEKKLLVFSDSRSAAANFAAQLSRAHEQHVRRASIAAALKTITEPIGFALAAKYVKTEMIASKALPPNLNALPMAHGFLLAEFTSGYATRRRLANLGIVAPCVRMIWYRLPGKAKLTVGPQGADHDQRFE